MSCIQVAHGTVQSLLETDGEGVTTDTSGDLYRVNEETALTTGEWAIVRPLFALYVEREQAMRLEVSRAVSLEVYGRQVSEVTADIAVMESPEGLPARAFAAAAFTVALRGRLRHCAAT
jgi:hypothetical protein